MMSFDKVFDLDSLLQAAVEVERDTASFFESLSAAEWDLRVGSAWTPAEHLDHLNIAVSAVARGLSMSRLILRVRFGRSHRASRTYQALRSDYRSRLASGAKATRGFIPSAQVPGVADSSRHGQLIERWHRVNVRLRDGLSAWFETDLDRIQLPHPLLGKITAREMVFFTIYHGGHHVEAAKSRLPRFTAPTVA